MMIPRTSCFLGTYVKRILCCKPWFDKYKFIIIDLCFLVLGLV